MKALRNDYLTYQKKIAHLQHIHALLAWDLEAMMPVKAGPGRAEQIGYIATISYDALVDPAYLEMIEKLLVQNDLEPWQRRSVVLAKKEREQTVCLEKNFVEHFESVKARAQQVRFEARRTNDFQLFATHLEEIISLTKAYASQIEPTKDAYDTLLDIYEEGATQSWYDSILLPLQKPSIELLHLAGENALLDDGSTWLTKDETQRLLHELCASVGFDFDAGMMGEVHHPFMTTVGGYDYRINTKYDNSVEAIICMIHELGHGLYEQNVASDYFYTNLHYGASTGMHESQSRTLENMLGRSQGMSIYLDTLSKKYGSQYTGDAKQWYNIYNRLSPSALRMEADEISYGLHILLRYELEKQLISGQLAVKDLPEAWNKKMITYLGVEPKTDTEGCLQDVHRSCGYIGYFPTYLLGNLYAGQFWNSFVQAHPDREQEVQKGNFGSYFNWYKNHIWTLGRSVSPQELLKHVTGEELNPAYFLQYLQDKFA